MVIENGNNYPVFKKNNLIIRKNVNIINMIMVAK